MDGLFGEFDPRRMPGHLFSSFLRLDYSTAAKADVTRQNYSVCPRHWYVDAIFQCRRCGHESCFSANEQRHWYEELGFYVESVAKHCPACRHDLRRLKAARQEYDRDIEAATRSKDPTFKRQLIATIDELCEGGIELPAKIHESRRLLAQQVAKAE